MRACEGHVQVLRADIAIVGGGLGVYGGDCENGPETHSDGSDVVAEQQKLFAVPSAREVRVVETA